MAPSASHALWTQIVKRYINATPLLLVMMPSATSSFVLLVVWPGATSSQLLLVAMPLLLIQLSSVLCRVAPRGLSKFRQSSGDMASLNCSFFLSEFPFCLVFLYCCSFAHLFPLVASDKCFHQYRCESRVSDVRLCF